MTPIFIQRELAGKAANRTILSCIISLFRWRFMIPRENGARLYPKDQPPQQKANPAFGAPHTAALLLALGLFCNSALAQPTSAVPTRAEILKGALTPERTCYHVSSYNLDVRIDPATKSLSGSNKITFKTVNDFTKMQVDLWSNLPISKIVFDDGAPASFTRELTARPRKYCANSSDASAGTTRGWCGRGSSPYGRC